MPKPLYESFNSKVEGNPNQNDSVAKQFASAMGLTNINDDGDNYKLYAAYGVVDPFTFASKLKEPVSIQDIKKMEVMGNKKPINLASASLGFINPVFGFFAFDTRSVEEKVIPLEGFMLLAYWSDKLYSIQELNSQKESLSQNIDNDLTPDVIDAIQSGVQMDCRKPRLSSVNVRGMRVDKGFATRVRPPFINKPYLTSFIFHGCFLMVHELGEGKKQNLFEEMSRKLGNDYALYLPATLKSEPVVIHNGSVYKFRK